MCNSVKDYSFLLDAEDGGVLCRLFSDLLGVGVVGCSVLQENAPFAYGSVFRRLFHVYTEDGARLCVDLHVRSKAFDLLYVSDELGELATDGYGNVRHSVNFVQESFGQPFVFQETYVFDGASGYGEIEERIVHLIDLEEYLFVDRVRAVFARKEDKKR
ncbi:MAG: hypothetical protein ACRC5C_03020 [Bacilli bacterium]